MKNPEIVYYSATEEQAEIAYERAQKSGRGIEYEYKLMGVKAITSPELAMQSQDPKREDRMAKLVRGALRLVGSANKKMGMVHGEEKLVPEIASIDPTVIAAAPKAAEAFYGIAESRLEKSIGSKALSLALGDDFDFENGSMLDTVQNRLFGEEKENVSLRGKVYRQLDKMAGVEKKSK